MSIQHIAILTSFPALSDSLRADQEREKKKTQDYLYDAGLHHRGWRCAKQKEELLRRPQSEIPSWLRMNILFAF